MGDNANEKMRNVEGTGFGYLQTVEEGFLFIHHSLFLFGSSPFNSLYVSS